VRLAIAPNPLQVDGIFHPAALVLVHRVTRLVGSLVNAKYLATECEHLRHEGHPVELAVLVESLQDFIPAADFNPVSYA
jgi:hypothetical protein